MLDSERASYPGIPFWFEESFNTNQMSREMYDVPIEHDLSIHESWKFYQELLQQQKTVLKSAADIAAFKYGL